MAGRTRSVRPEDPWAGNMPPKQFVQFLDPAGHERLPARDFDPRAAKWLLKEKGMRVFFRTPWMESGESICPGRMEQVPRKTPQTVNCFFAIIALIPQRSSYPA